MIIYIIMISICMCSYNISLLVLYKKSKGYKINFNIRNIIFIILSVIGQMILEGMRFNIDIFGEYIYSILLIKVMYDESLIEAFQYFLCATVFMQIAKLITSIPIFVIMNNGCNINMVLVNFIDYMGIFIFTMAATNLLPIKFYYGKCKKILGKVNFLMINLIIFVLVLKLMSFYEFNFFQEYFFIILAVFIIFILITILFARYNVRIKEQEMQIKTYSMYNPIIMELTEEIKSKQHDFKNHINTIYGIIQTTETEELKSQLEKYFTELNLSLNAYDETITINNKLIAAIIYVKNNYAKAENIKFCYEVECDLKELKLKDFEVSEILNNLLDNSFTAVKNEDEEQRKVNLRLFTDEEYFCIYIKNGGLTVEPSEVDKIFNKGFSTKKERGHGYGLYNVKKIVQAYNGKIELSAKERVLEMLLCFPK